MEAKKCDRCKTFYTKFDIIEEVKPTISSYTGKIDRKDKPSDMHSFTTRI